MVRRTPTKRQLQPKLTRSAHDVFQLHHNLTAHDSAESPVIESQVCGVLAKCRAALFQRDTDRE